GGGVAVAVEVRRAAGGADVPGERPEEVLDVGVGGDFAVVVEVGAARAGGAGAHAAWVGQGDLQARAVDGGAHVGASAVGAAGVGVDADDLARGEIEHRAAGVSAGGVHGV